MATRRRLLPGQSFGYEDHPSNVGSPSYYADTGRGWVPNSLPSNYAKKKVDRGGRWEHPISPTRRLPSDRQPGIGFANQRRRVPTFGFDRSGEVTNIGRYSGAPGGIGGAGITATAPGQKYITRATDKDEEKQAAFDHRATAHFAPWFADVMDKFGGLTEGAMRGSRLHKKYKDAYGDSKQWEADKKMMVPSWDLKRGDAGYEGSDRQFYDKYMNLYERTGDEAHKDTAETAWRNKQTSDRLAAATGFEDYAPGKYTGVGEGSRYTGDVYEGQGRTGKFVPGVGIMDDIQSRLNRLYPGREGGPQDYERGEHWTDTSGDIFNVGRDYETGEHWNIDDTPFGLTETEDVTADVDDYYTEGELWEDTSNDLYGDRLYETGEMMDDPQYSLGDWGFYDKPVGPRGMLGTERAFEDLALRNSGFVGPFNRNTGLPFNTNVGLPRVDNLTVNPKLNSVIEEDEETFIPKRGRLGLYD